MTSRPLVCLIVLDGFGCRAETSWNAIAAARTPLFRHLFKSSAWTTLEASGLRVGLPEGQMGNSEVGHLNIGAGRVVDQDLVRINKAVQTGQLSRSPVLVDAFSKALKSGTAVHFAGLLSDGGVHSQQNHLHGLIDAALANGMTTRDGAPSVFVHAILDGRDTSPISAVKYLNRLLDFIRDKPQVHLADVIGRYYSMDRDRRWERIQRGYDLMTFGTGTETSDAVATVERFYQDGINDEFMEPISVRSAAGAVGRVSDGDTLLFFNYRADRMRQLVTTFRDPAITGFERTRFPHVHLMSMVRYHEDFAFPVVFPPVSVHNHLGEIFSREGMRQLRIAETEKYAHVTFFFNGGSDAISEGEERVLIPSPKVPTYDLQPAMSLRELADRVVQEIDGGKYQAVILNIANPDMVGHTGKMEAAVEAIEETDAAMAKILDAVRRARAVALITADHGNCELMYDEAKKQPHTAHTNFPVPFILFDPAGNASGTLRKGGALENVAPTLLDILGIEKPAEMTAESLFERGPSPR
ncbi:MAG TPA: 2,3-bisphosphoglycerate-independent phosphoglycerate mutase [Thermoanaerobaculia bacterium]|nr:2,3-bisphosphoglycerate-independent phosphoglycerate mutase [Thermoanaerobaculia bacterium]